MKKYIIALDEGTSSCRTLIFDHDCNLIACDQKEIPQIYPQNGWVEQDPEIIFNYQYETLLGAITKSGISPSEIAGIGITNQRETTIVWDKNTGKPVYNAIVWQCRRTANICKQMQEDSLSDYVKSTTGLTIDAYFSGTKIKWILDNVPLAKEAAKKGDLLFGTVDSWLIWKLTNGKVHVTDFTNASRTMLFNISKGTWDKKLLEYLDIPESMLPTVLSSSEVYGNVNINYCNIPISGIAGDQQAALFGQKCFNFGDTKCTYGTGCFLLTNTGTQLIPSKNGLVTTIAATLKGQPLEYALEGSVFMGGAIIQWLRDSLKIIQSSKDTEAIALSVNDTNGVYIVPAFTGLGAPYWNMDARGSIFGLSRGANSDHIVRAALESIAFQTNDLLQAVKQDLGSNLSSFKADGGAANNKFLMQFQSDISNITIQKPSSVEATAMGAAFLAGLSTGFYRSKNELNSICSDYTSISPIMEEKTRQTKCSEWIRAIKGCINY